MDEFNTVAKLWPTETELDLGTDSNVLGGPATFTRDAPQYVTSPDGTQTYQFLFWNTGRHMTNKRRVRWIFSVLGWGVWTATRWYGSSGGGGGPPRVRADPFSIGGDATLTGTPIDDAASTYPPGAWPFNGDDHVIGTANGAASVIAKDPFLGYDFAGWLRLMWGGDPNGEFVETDAGSNGQIGGAGFFDHVTGTAFNAAQGTSADLLAAYGYKPKAKFPDWLKDIFKERMPAFDIPSRVDPAPEDLVRLVVLGQLLRQTQPGSVQGADFQGLMEAVPRMNQEELKRAMQSVQITLDLGKTALGTIEAQLKRSAK